MAGPLFPPWICPLDVRGALIEDPLSRSPPEEGWGEGHQDYDDPHSALRATLADPSSRLSETSSITTSLPIDSPMRSTTNDTPAFLPSHSAGCKSANNCFKYSSTLAIAAWESRSPTVVRRERMSAAETAHSRRTR